MLCDACHMRTSGRSLICQKASSPQSLVACDTFATLVQGSACNQLAYFCEQSCLIRLRVKAECNV